MSSSPPDLAALKARMRDTWMAGDFGVMARYSAEAAEEFVARLKIPRASRVLDVACGTGNLSIPAARTGAVVTGVDIATNLLEQARHRAAREELQAKFEEGDAEKLPYPDASFDIVMTMFGAMFAPRPEVAAAELLRVCRPGGLVAMANWTPTGFVGQMFATSAKHVPPPGGIPAPVLWGDETTVRQRFAKGTASISCLVQTCKFHYPFPPNEVVELYRQYFGPTQAAFSRLDPQGQKALATDLENLWKKHNEAHNETSAVSAQYLEVRVVKA
ncbi:MAG TPA: class I SAM-dependent methyltransferase [Verrucomicrobiae bacterium]|nr:class I SAM-dependent methyltransferase [Verrucomicrobiae bacterium]